MKTCRTCNQSKESSEFSKNSSTADGIDNQCKECTKIEIRKFLRTVSGRYMTLKRVAKRRNTQMELTKELFAELIKQPCRYCGDLMDESSGTYFVDRLDSSKGYTVENSVPCCTVCNFMKGDLEEGTFLNYVEKIGNRLCFKL